MASVNYYDVILKPLVTEKSMNSMAEKKELLNNIIEKINIMFEGKFEESDRVIIETI